MLTSEADARRLLEKLIGEAARAEIHAIEHPDREARRIAEAPPVLALRAIAAHASSMQARFATLVEGHALALPHRSAIGTTIAALRHLVIDRAIDMERSYRTTLIALRLGIEIVTQLRELARQEVMFGLIRWCDDWLGARRPLVARAEAQLGWFADRALLPPSVAPRVPIVHLDDDFEPTSSAGDSDSRDQP